MLKRFAAFLKHKLFFKIDNNYYNKIKEENLSKAYIQGSR